MMKGKNFLVMLSALTGVLILASLIAGSVYSGDFEYRLRTKKFNRILAEKENLTSESLNKLKERLEMGIDSLSAGKTDIFEVAGEEGITFLEYFDGKLVYWSDNSFDVPVIYDDSLFSKPLLFIHNGWFIRKSLISGNEKFIAMLRIRNDYGFENDLVKNGFVPVFDLPEGTGISFDKADSDFSVTDNEGKWLFSLVYPEEKTPSYFIIIPVVLWVISLLLIVVLALFIARHFSERGRVYLAVLFPLLMLASLYLIILLARKPEVFFMTGLFSGYHFSLNGLIPSLGHLFAISILLAALSWIIYRHFPLKVPRRESRLVSWFYLTGLMLIEAVFFMVYHHIFTNLILNSNISFEPYRVLELSLFSFIGFASLFLLLLVPLLFMLKIWSGAIESDFCVARSFCDRCSEGSLRSRPTYPFLSCHFCYNVVLPKAEAW
jgi:hypothetical protein